MGIADNPINRTGYVAATDIANNRSVIPCKTSGMLLQPVMILNGCFDTAFLQNLYTHLFQRAVGAP